MFGCLVSRVKGAEAGCEAGSDGVLILRIVDVAVAEDRPTARAVGTQTELY